MSLPDLSNEPYWLKVTQWADNYGSDGCTGVPDDLYIQACWEHDFHYRYAVTMFGEAISVWEANFRFLKVMQMLSKWGRFAPISWVRFIAVTLFGWIIWRQHRAEGQIAPFKLEA